MMQNKTNSYLPKKSLFTFFPFSFREQRLNLFSHQEDVESTSRRELDNIALSIQGRQHRGRIDGPKDLLQHRRKKTLPSH